LKNLSSKTYPPARGFTVVELAVSSTIIILILGLVLANYPRFRARNSLAALARNVALLVREAQVYGLAVKEFPQIKQTFPPYGIHISTKNIGEIILFGDLQDGERTGAYDSGDGCGSGHTECIKRISLSGPEFVDKVCVLSGGGATSDKLTENCQISELNISFRRPDPAAVIIVDNLDFRYNAAKIYLRSNKGSDETRVIRVWITGQISIE